MSDSIWEVLLPIQASHDPHVTAQLVAYARIHGHAYLHTCTVMQTRQNTTHRC